MRHHIVTRIVRSLVGACVVAIVAFAWSVTRPGAPPPRDSAPVEGPTGAALFSRHCAMCHEASATGLSFRDSAERETAVAEFREFLVDHYGPSPEGIALIVSHVMASGPD